MDDNKLNKLRNINYSIKKCCGTCKYANINHVQWGTCTKHQYKHKKHTGGLRELSINVFGYCSDHETREYYISSTDHYKEFHERS